MPGKSGRPTKQTAAEKEESKQLIINAAVKLISKKGADFITVRNVCREADIGTGTFYYHFKNKDDLLMHFLREISFEKCKLQASPEQIAERIAELYMHLIDRYMELGPDFMKSFYSTGNRSLSAYMGEVEGAFPKGTVMARSETEVRLACEHGIIIKNADIHEICMDVCTIVKGCVFEWCLTDGKMDIRNTLIRILRRYFKDFN